MEAVNLNLIVAIIIFGAGFIMFAFSLVQFIKAYRSRQWNTATGTIITSEVDRASGRDRSRNFRAYIVFRYKVRNQEYENDRVSYSSKLYTNSDKRAQKIVAQYQTGQQVTVYYPSDNPSEGILRTGVTREQVAGIVISLIFLGFGILLLLLMK